MEIVVSVINLIIVPFVGVIVLYRREHKEMKATMELMADWILFLVITMIICHIGLMILSKATGIVISAQSTLYTIGATIITCCLPYITEVIKKYIKLKVELKFEVKKR